MLLYPAVDKLKNKVDSKYTLVIMAAKRARALVDGKPQLTLTEGFEKPLSIATKEVSEDLISYKRVDPAPEEDAEAEDAETDTPEAETDEEPAAEQ